MNAPSNPTEPALDGYWEVGTPSPEHARFLSFVDEVRRCVNNGALLGRRGLTASQVGRLEAAAHVLAEVVDEVAGESDHASGPNGGLAPVLERSPVSGRGNPRAVPWDLRREGHETVVEATFPPALDGPPGAVHGGFVAANFDELMGIAQSVSGQAGLTRYLNVIYHAPSPTGVSLRFRASVVRVEGRKTFCHGTLHHGETLTAEAEALFIALRA